MKKNKGEIYYGGVKMYENKLKEIREKKNMSQFELSKEANITQADISKIENQRIIAHPGWRKRLAKTLNVPEGELFPNEIFKIERM